MDSKLKGGIYGCIAAISYGLNPLCALFLYQDGLQTYSVLFYRFALGALMLAAILLWRRISFRISRHEAFVLAALGLLFAASSITYFLSFHHMAAGIAATLVFAYPVMVAIIMAIFFHERLTLPAVLSIVLTVAGIALLYEGDGGEPLSTVGVILVMVSALTYALYIIVVNRSRIVMSSLKLTFYALLVCMVAVTVFAFASGQPLQPLTSGRQWFYAALLGLVPTVISLVFMAMAIKQIGSTPTAIMGALEPVTAVAVGALVFGEALPPRLSLGILTILAAVVLIIVGGKLHRPAVVSRLARAGRLVLKRWRWK